MKKKNLQLCKKLVLRKDDIAPLNPEQLPAIVGGASLQPCNQTILCPVTQHCNASKALSCQSQCLACHTYIIVQCITFPPGC